MSNKRITDLTELTTPTTDDVFPVVDIATNTTTKVQLANLPVQTAVTTALATKQDTLVSGTNIKTVNSTSLVGSGNVAVQPTLVSGTNIKTLNSVSLLGAGDIVLAATPSGVSGAIQFSNGSAFASDAANLFWDDTNNRLGVGTNAPTRTLTSQGIIGLNDSTGAERMYISPSGASGVDMAAGNGFRFDVRGGVGTTTSYLMTSLFGIGTTSPSARTHIVGSGSTSATTSLLVQNSGGFSSLLVRDDNVVQGFDSASGVRFQLGNVTNGQGISTRNGNFAVGFIDSGQTASLRFLVVGSGASYIDGYTEGSAKAQNFPIFFGSRVNNVGTAVANVTTQENGCPVVFGSAVSDASAVVQVNSTTRGFLPPRMTTTQKNAIATPAAGLVVYDSTTNKLQCYNGSTWNDLF
jgi:hypothetical protein